jgi:predicted membrane-bound spermidine synthase
VPVPLRYRIFLALLVLGAFSQVVQALLIREGLVVFYGNEISLGAFYGSWLFWLALGSVAVIRLRKRPWVQAPLGSLSLLAAALPLVLTLQILALRTARGLLEVSASEFVPLGQLFLSLFLITAPSGLALGLTFPLGCRALRDAQDGAERAAVGLVARLYVADALGALVGGALFTFVLIQWLGLVQTLGLVTLALGLTAWSLMPRSRPLALVSLSLALAGLVLAVSPAAPRLERALEVLRFANLQPGLELLDSAETRYGHVAVARLGEQLSIVGDGQVRESFPLPRETLQQGAYFASQAGGARRVLLFGGLAGGLPAELLRYPVEQIDLVEEDARALERVRPYLPPETQTALEDPRLRLVLQDGRRHINRLPKDAPYDLVLALQSAPSSAASNRYFTRDFYARVREHLAPDGVFCTQVSAASNYLGQAVGGYAGSVYHTLGSVFPQIALVPGDPQVFCASPAEGRLSEDPAELERRYRAIPLAEHRLPTGAFQNLLPAQEVAYARERLGQTPAEINTDQRPVTYYLNMVLWGKFSASVLVDWLGRLRDLGPWPYLLPPLLFVLLWLLRAGLEGFQRPALLRGGALYALVTLGLASMAAQLTLLFSYQSQLGLVFERIALLNGLFMTGLALGAGLGTRLAALGRPAAALTLVLLLVAAAMLALPWGLGVLCDLGSQAPGLQEAGYLALSAGLGLLTGTGFPLGVDLTHRSRPEITGSGGATAAADNLGGALGGLVTGALLVPLLGVEMTSRVLAALVVIALVPLLAGRLAPDSLARPGGRGSPSFPWPGLGWGLLYAVLLVYGWTLLERGAGPGPRLYFDEPRLAEVSGSARFEPVQSPFPHYLGFAPGDAAEAETASLSSLAAAPEVRGFAGPLNLLLAVDRDGTLRGVRHVESGETPAYVAGIDQWLRGLAGRSLKEGPLTLERVDGLSGATVTSRAALESINRSAARVVQAAFGESLPAPPKRPGTRLDAAFWVTLLLLAAVIPVHLSGSERARLGLQVAALGVLGIWLNTLVTEVDLVNLSLGQLANPANNPQRWLLLGFVLLTTPLLGPLWCGYLCPFGALQELLSRLGRLLGLRSYPDRPLEQRIRFTKFLLLGLMLIAVWVSGEPIWASFNPMQHAFGGRLSDWMAALVALVLLGSVVYVRFWCRYFCPLGALLALGNKLAWLQGLAPRRRFEHCDLGVRGEFDLDCIRCGRCLTGSDTQLRRHGHRVKRPDTPGAAE